MQHAGHQYGQGAVPSSATSQRPAYEASEQPSPGSSSITSSLRQWRKKDAIDRQQQNQQQSAPAEQQPPSSAPSVPSVVENPTHVARVAPQTHYSRNPGDIYRYPPHYPDYGLAYKDPQNPVRYSEIVEGAANHNISSVIQDQKEKEYMKMCSIQQPHIKQFPDHLKQPYADPMKQTYDSSLPQYTQLPPFVQKESQMQQAYLSRDNQYQYCSKFSNPCPRNFPAENNYLATLNKINPRIAQSIMNDPHFQFQEGQQNSNYLPAAQRMYHNQQQVHATPSYTSPRNMPQPPYGYLQQYGYKPPEHFSRLPQYPVAQANHKMGLNIEQPSGPISPRRSYDTMPMNYAAIPQKISPTFPQCSQLEYSRHYQHRRMQMPPEYLPPQTYKPPFIQNHQHSPETSDEVPSNSIKQFLENWVEEDIATNGSITDITVQKNPGIEAERVPSVKGPRQDETHEQYYVVEASEFSQSNLPQYVQVQSLDKLPENVRGYYENSLSDSSRILIKNTGVQNMVSSAEVIPNPSQVNIIDSRTIAPPNSEQVVNLHIVEAGNTDGAQLGQEIFVEGTAQISSDERCWILKNSVVVGEKGEEHSSSKSMPVLSEFDPLPQQNAALQQVDQREPPAINEEGKKAEQIATTEEKLEKFESGPSPTNGSVQSPINESALLCSKKKDDATNQKMTEAVEEKVTDHPESPQATMNSKSSEEETVIEESTSNDTKEINPSSKTDIPNEIHVVAAAKDVEHNHEVCASSVIISNIPKPHVINAVNANEETVIVKETEPDLQAQDPITKKDMSNCDNESNEQEPESSEQENQSVVEDDFQVSADSVYGEEKHVPEDSQEDNNQTAVGQLCENTTNHTSVIKANMSTIVQQTESVQSVVSVEEESAPTNEEASENVAAEEKSEILTEVVADRSEDSPPCHADIEAPQEDSKEDCQSQEFQYRSALKVDNNNVLLQIDGALVEIRVTNVNGKKVISVVPLSNAELVNDLENVEEEGEKDECSITPTDEHIDLPKEVNDSEKCINEDTSNIQEPVSELPTIEKDFCSILEENLDTDELAILPPDNVDVGCEIKVEMDDAYEDCNPPLLEKFEGVISIPDDSSENETDEPPVLQCSVNGSENVQMALEEDEAAFVEETPKQDIIQNVEEDKQEETEKEKEEIQKSEIISECIKDSNRASKEVPPLKTMLTKASRKLYDELPVKKSKGNSEKSRKKDVIKNYSKLSIVKEPKVSLKTLDIVSNLSTENLQEKNHTIVTDTRNKQNNVLEKPSILKPSIKRTQKLNKEGKEEKETTKKRVQFKTDLPAKLEHNGVKHNGAVQKKEIKKDLVVNGVIKEVIGNININRTKEVPKSSEYAVESNTARRKEGMPKISERVVESDIGSKKEEPPKISERGAEVSTTGTESTENKATEIVSEPVKPTNELVEKPKTPENNISFFPPKRPPEPKTYEKVSKRRLSLQEYNNRKRKTFEQSASTKPVPSESQELSKKPSQPNLDNRISCLKSHTTQTVIDANEFDIASKTEEDVLELKTMRSYSCPSGTDDIKSYKEEVDIKLNSLELQIPKRSVSPIKQSIVSRTVQENDLLMRRFLNREVLTPEEVQKVKEIIKCKRVLEEINKAKLLKQASKDNTESRKPNLTSESSDEKAKRGVYEVKSDRLNVETVDANCNLKLHLKKVPEADKRVKKRKRFRNLYTEQSSDSGDECSKLNRWSNVEDAIDNDYHAYQTNVNNGVPKIIIKRLMQPYVKLERSPQVELLAKKRKVC